MLPIYAQRIRGLRDHYGFSQEQLAELTGVSQNQISRYERGANDPTGEVLIALAKALNTSVDFILGITNDPTPLKDLTENERGALSAWRQGDREGAISIILSDRDKAGVG